ncbi:battenin, partial [Trypanosoma grayi]|uniref:battenin n=1 Tax=Trypanosoma grayi TaxID=71804 RepID=UPI0004F42B2F
MRGCYRCSTERHPSLRVRFHFLLLQTSELVTTGAVAVEKMAAVDFSREQERVVHAKNLVRNAFSMWCLGMINNFHYTLVLACSDSTAESYGMKRYVAIISWANVFFGILSRIVNAFLLPLLSYNIRVTATSMMVILAILLMTFAWDIGAHKNVAAFIVTLIGVVFIGVAGSYGEAVFLGYMERMPSKQIGAWSSGTGLSGVAASLI